MRASIPLLLLASAPGVGAFAAVGHAAQARKFLEETSGLLELLGLPAILDVAPTAAARVTQGRTSSVAHTSTCDDM
jgi:hypothetical protein